MSKLGTMYLINKFDLVLKNAFLRNKQLSRQIDTSEKDPVNVVWSMGKGEIVCYRVTFTTRQKAKNSLDEFDIKLQS